MGKRLSEEKIEEIKELREQGLSYEQISEQVGVSYNTAWKYGRPPEEDKEVRRPLVQTKSVGARISISMWKKIIQLLKAGVYVNTTDYLRDVIRKDLISRGFSLTPSPKEEEAEPNDDVVGAH